MSYKILSKFIKDVSFEIPNIQTFAMLEKEIAKYSLNFDIKSNKFKDNIIEINTILKLTPNTDVKNKSSCYNIYPGENVVEVKRLGVNLSVLRKLKKWKLQL